MSEITRVKIKSAAEHEALAKAAGEHGVVLKRDSRRPLRYPLDAEAHGSVSGRVWTALAS